MSFDALNAAFPGAKNKQIKRKKKKESKKEEIHKGEVQIAGGNAI